MFWKGWLIYFQLPSTTQLSLDHGTLEKEDFLILVTALRAAVKIIFVRGGAWGIETWEDPKGSEDPI